MYQFLLNMWILRKIDENYLIRMVEKSYLTKEEKAMLLATQQILK